MTTHGVDRRGFLTVAGALLAGCAAAPWPSPASPLLQVLDLTGLLPRAGLRWLLVVKPRELMAHAWLIPPIWRIAPEARLERWAVRMGFDARQSPEAAIASYAQESGATLVYLARHNGDAATVERCFRARLTRGEQRAQDRPGLVRVSGMIGEVPAMLAVLGSEVAVYQFGSPLARGPARVAALYAEQALKKSPTVLAEEPLRSLSARLGTAPLRAFAVGPFEGALARGARGLLAGATAFGGTVRPSAREGLGVVLQVAGDFSQRGAAAAQQLAAAWNDLAYGSFGHLLGLDAPLTQPAATHAAEAVTLTVELEPERLSQGLAAATSAQIEEIMR